MNTMLLDSVTADNVVRSIPAEGSLGALAAFFDALSDITRLKLVSALSVSAMCVSDLSTVTALNQTTVSHQLRILRNANIVKSRRQGKVLFYSLCLGQIPSIMNCAVAAVLD